MNLQNRLFFIPIFILVACGNLSARVKFFSFCEQGGKQVHTNSQPSSDKFQQSYPGATVNVYYTGGWSGTVTTSGTAVTWTGGQYQFNANSGWVGLVMTINSVPYMISTVNSTTSITLSTSAGTQASPVLATMPSTAPVPVFSDNTGTIKGNPYTCDSTTAQQFIFADTGTYDFRFSGTGIISAFTISAISGIDPVDLPNYLNLRASPCLAKGDGVTNDTSALTTCLTAAAALGYAVYAPAGNYAICSSSPTLNNRAVVLYGDGPNTTSFIRHSSCIGAATDMIVLTTTSSVYLHDFGIDSLNTSGSPVTNSDINIQNATKVDVDHLFVTHGQAVGLECQTCSNVTVSSSTFSHNWCYGLSIANGTGGTAAPVYRSGYNLHGNTYIENPVGLALNFFVRDISVTGETVINSSIGLVQTPDARAVFSGNSVDGIDTYGSTSCGVLTSNEFAGIGLEGVGNALITGNTIRNVVWGIYAQGSNLQIPAMGTVMQQPINNVVIKGNHIDSTSGYTILVSGTSTGGTPGSQVSIKENFSTNSGAGPDLSGVDSSEISKETADHINFNCFTVNNITHWSFTDNRAHNCSALETGTYYGLEITGTSGTLNGDVYNNEFINDNGSYTMAGCVADDPLSVSSPTQIRHWGNRCPFAGITFNAWNPLPTVPTLGAWGVGDRIENFPVSAGGFAAANIPLGWQNIFAGSQGQWAELGETIPPPCITASGTPVCSSAASGLVAIATGQTSLTVSTSAIRSATSRLTINGPFQGYSAALGVDCTATGGAILATGSINNAISFTFNVAAVSGAGKYACYSFEINNAQ